MSNTEVIEHIIEWDDSSQHLDTIPQMNDNGDILSSDDNIIIEVITPESASTESLNSNTADSSPLKVEVETVNANSTDNKIEYEYVTVGGETPPESPSAENQDNAKKSRGKKPPIKAKRVKPKRKTASKKNASKTEADDKPKPVELPSVYSKNQIARHNKRINKLKELEQDDESDSDASNEDADATSKRDLDINLRIFEGSGEAIDNVVIGEIQCNIIDDHSSAEVEDNSNKNGSNVFKLSVNTNFVDVCDNKSTGSTIEDISVAEFDADDPLDFSDNDSDLEILVSKPIVRYDFFRLSVRFELFSSLILHCFIFRKRATPAAKKEKPTEKKQKLTMYDLIHDNVCLSCE